jgi:hypothetical protein
VKAPAGAGGQTGGVGIGQGVQMRLEGLEAPRPLFRHEIEIAARQLELLGRQHPAALSPPPLAPDQTRAGQHPEVLGDGLPGDGRPRGEATMDWGPPPQRRATSPRRVSSPSAAKRAAESARAPPLAAMLRGSGEMRLDRRHLPRPALLVVPEGVPRQNPIRRVSG